MGAWNLIAGLILFVVFLSNIQILEAVPKGDSSHELQRMIFPELRKGSALDATLKKYSDCIAKWRARIGELCIPVYDVFTELGKLRETHGLEAPASELKKVYKRACQLSLNCSDARVCVECNETSTGDIVFSCAAGTFPKQDLTQNCDNEIKAVHGSRNPGKSSGVIYPSQNYQYVILVAVILFVIHLQ